MTRLGDELMLGLKYPKTARGGKRRRKSVDKRERWEVDEEKRGTEMISPACGEPVISCLS
jgi:hypothetical protein